MTRLHLYILAGLFASAVPAESERSSIYSPVGKRDPFKAPAADTGRDVQSLNPLEKFSLDKIQLKAVLKGMGKARAMFEDPEGRSFILSEGDLIGRERGTVSRILNTEVIITERTFNYLGAENLYERVLSLPEDQELNEVDGGVRNNNAPVRNAPRLNNNTFNAPAAPAFRAPAAPAAAQAPAARNFGGANVGGGNVR